MAVNKNVEDEMWLKWQEMQSKIYDEMNYKSNPIISYVTNHGHSAVERPFRSQQKFDRVLEIGAGTGEHLQYVRHQYEQYVLTDLSQSQLDVAETKHSSNKKVVFEIQNALSMTYPDNSFDRLISIYNLEHIPDPHIALKEWSRVVKPGGTISIALPVEGGIPWNLGRYLTTRRSFKKVGLDLDYLIAREHINPCYRLHSLIKYYFKNRKDQWFPLVVPLTHLNLVFSTTIINEK